MVKKPEPPRPIIYKLAAKRESVGAVEVADEATAIEKAAAEFKAPVTRLMAIRR